MGETQQPTNDNLPLLARDIARHLKYYAAPLEIPEIMEHVHELLNRND